MLNVKQVRQLAKNLHKMQRLKNGKKYFGHVLRVAEFSRELFFKECGLEVISQSNLDDLEIITQAAYLHDALEDRCTEEVLLASGVAPEVVKVVKLLSKNLAPEGAYLSLIKENRHARIVKMADLQHNSLLSRLVVGEDMSKTQARLLKYIEQYVYLRDA